MRPVGTPASAARGGLVLYELYRAASRAAAPVVLMWRRLRGLEHPSRWPERLGRPSAGRPCPGFPLVWFHAVSLGEGMAALPVVRQCVRLHPGLPVLLTTTTLSSFQVIKDLLPDGVIYQFAPLDCPGAIENFLGYWKPSLILLMESELWPNLILSAAEKGIAVALLNARISLKSFNRWSVPLGLPLISLMLSKLSLVIPLSTIEAVRFQLLHAPAPIIHFAGDLKYAVGELNVVEKAANKIKDLQQQIGNRPLWMAASIHKGEEEVMLRVHGELIKALKRQKIDVVLRSTREVISQNTRIYVVDTLGELRMLYKVTPVTVIGGSLIPGLAGHNISEAAAAGCAVLIGPHVGHFYHMLVEMWQINPLSVKQVTGESELLEMLKELLSDSKALELRQRAAKEAFAIMSDGVVSRVWNLVRNFALSSQLDTRNG